MATQRSSLWIFCQLTIASLSIAKFYGAPAGFECIHGKAKVTGNGNGSTRIESSGRAVIHWSEFSIGPNEAVYFDQLGIDKTVLNRVVGKNSSHLLGSLLSNGNVYLINPNGVLIGPGARIETNGFLASTADILDRDFINGKEMLFEQSGKDGTIINQGVIHCPAGDVFLFATHIDNQGEIKAPQGVVGLSSGTEILLAVEGNERIYIRPKQEIDGLINHAGKIQGLTVELKAQGSPFASAIRSSGEIDAGQLVESQGRIYLKAQEGKVEINGKMTAASICVTGDEAHIFENSRIIANGKDGGEIIIGGDLKGANPDIKNAKRTYVQNGAFISANAIDDGAGGKIVVWSDEHTVFEGHVEATGSQQGGFVEISGGRLKFNGTSDLRSTKGPIGTLLLDPQNIVINAGGGVFVGPTDPFANNVGGTDTFTGASLASVINTSAVVLQANTDVTFDDAVTTVAAVGSLTVQAGRSITFTINGNVALTGTAFFNATINDAAAIGGDRTAGNAGFTMNAGSSLTSTTGNITVNFGSFGGTAQGYVLLNGSTINSTSGIINISGQGYGAAAVAPDNTGITMQGASLISSGNSVNLNGTGGAATVNIPNGISLSGTSTIQITGAGNLNMTGSVPAGATTGTTSGILGTGGVIIQSTAGSTGNITITGSNAATDALGINPGTNFTSTIRSLGQGTLTINGTGSPNSSGGANDGIFFTSPARISSVNGNIQLNGTRGGIMASNASQSVELVGNVLITATGPAGVNIQATTGTNPSGGNCSGFVMNGAGGTQCLISAVDGNIILNGTGSSGGSSSSYGVHMLNCSFPANAGLRTTGAGNIQITGLGLSGNMTRGVEMENSTIIASGAGQVTINGTTTSTGAGQAVTGFSFTVTAPQTNFIRTANGNITITGIGGGGGGSQESNGVYVSGGAIVGSAGIIESLGAGVITLTGTSPGTSANGDNRGVMLDINSIVRSTGTGAINITGTGSSSGGPGNHGVSISGGVMGIGSGGQVQSITGPITIIGQGQGANVNNSGVFIGLFGDVLSTGPATINIQGTGGNGSQNNNGIEVNGTGSSITSSGTGTVTLVGQGGPGSLGAASQNQGIRVDNNGLITSVTGNITATGTGGGTATGNNNIGIDVDTGGDIVTTGSASLILVGNGGNGTTANSGIQVDGAGSTISSTANGAISLTGNGSTRASATSQNQGVRVSNSGLVTALNGSITANGTGGGNGAGTNNVGIDIDTAGQITSTGSAFITTTGTGGAGTSANYGVQISGLLSQISSSSTGSISVIGNHGAATLEDIVVELSGSILSATSAPITMTANLSDLLIRDAGAVNSLGTGTVTANAVNDVRVEAGAGASQSAQINLTDGDAFITAQGDVIVRGNSGMGSYAQIGNNTLAAVPATADITVTAGGNVVVDGSDLDGYAIIGHGNPQSLNPLTLTGNITVSAVDVLIDGADTGPGPQGFGQIGHINAQAVATTLSGDIFIDVTNDIVLTGGTAANTAHARVGHGGLSAGIAPTVNGNILMIADVDIIMNSNPTGQAQVQNLGIGTVTCVVDDLFPSSCFFGPGQFILSVDSLIDTTGGQLRIYTVMPSQNTISELINGAPFIAGPFNVNSATETWSTYYSAGAYGGPEFNLYYKIPCIIDTLIAEIVSDLAIDNSQLVTLLPNFLPFTYENYPYHPKVCIRDWIERNLKIAKKQPEVIDTDCEPTFIRFDSMIFENYLR